ncbi:hypothetical protein B0J12DRAFT_548080, partial [Macrophomina phaseolina]
TPEPLPAAKDDTTIKPEPSRCIDYLSDDWREEDIRSSWRYITANRKTYGQLSRLENASWRRWAKAKYRLRTISPETLNWSKDCDMTWLYGPLQTSSNTPFPHHGPEASSNISTNNSFFGKKPILKKRTISEIMLQPSVSNSLLVKQAATATRAQRSSASPLRTRERLTNTRATSDSVILAIPSTSSDKEAMDSVISQSPSCLHSPGDGGKKHIRFDNKVAQYIVVGFEYGDDYEDDNWSNYEDDTEDDSEDDGLELRTKPRQFSHWTSKNSFDPERKTIEKLPDTTLMYRSDSPDVPYQVRAHSLGFGRSSRLSPPPSPSQETLRPSRPSRNLLLGNEDNIDGDIPVEILGAFVGQCSSTTVGRRRLNNEDDGESCQSDGLQRITSGIFTPYEEDEDEIMAVWFFSKVVDIVNAMKDIAYIFWNIGW